MKHLARILAALMVIMCLFGCQEKQPEQQEEQIPTPFTEEETLAAAFEKVGFELSLPANFKPNLILAYEGNMLHTEVKGEDDSYLYIRKAPADPATPDISGDFNDYGRSEKVVMNGQNVTIRMDKGKIHVAYWTDGAYSYCIGTSAGMTVDEVIDFVEQIH